MADRGEPLPRGLCRAGRRIRRRFWAKAAREIDWVKPADEDVRSRSRRLRALVRRAPVQHLPQRRRPACRRRAAASRRRSSTTARSTGTKRDITYARTARRGRGARRGARGPRRGKGDRVILYMPMIPEAVIAMLACARIGAIHSVVFGGFAAEGTCDPHRRCEAEGRSCPLPAASRGPGSCPTSRSSTRRCRLPPPSPRPASCSSGRRRRPRFRRGATTIGPKPSPRRAPMGAAAACVPRSRDRSALRALHLGHDRKAQGRRARQRRPHGRAQMVDEEHLRRRTRRGVLGRLRRRLGGRPFLHRLRAASARLHHDPLRGKAGRHARCGRVLAGHRRARRRRRCSPRRPRSARSRRRIRAPRYSQRYDLSRFRALFLAGERADPDTVQWAERILGVPVIDHWWQTETGWPIAGNPARPRRSCRSSTARRPCRCRATTCRSSTKAASPVAAGHDGLDRHPAAAAARLPPDPVERGRALPRKLPRGLPRLLQHVGCGLHRRGRLRLRHGPHGRHHQRRRAPALDGRHGGGARVPSGRRRMRRHRRAGTPQGRGALRLRGAEVRGRPRCRTRSRPNSSPSCARRSARSRPSSLPSRSGACRRHAPARSCAAR